MKISVKAKHIKAGKVGRTTCCPIALALRERGFVCAVSRSKIIVKGTGPKGIHDSPCSVDKFIARFDTHRPVKPFTFEIDL